MRVIIIRRNNIYKTIENIRITIIMLKKQKKKTDINRDEK